MKRLIQLQKTLFLLPLLAVTLMFLGADNLQSKSKVSTAIGNDVSQDQWRPVTLDPFEGPWKKGDRVFGPWDLEGPWKAVSTPYDPDQINSRVDQRYVDGKPGDLRDTPHKQVFGVKFQFRYPGYNFITVFPPVLKDKKDGSDALDPVTKERIGPAIPIPGIAKKLSVWVLSQGKKYVLEGYLRDWKGNTHRVLFKHRDVQDGKYKANLRFIGWRPMVAEVPVDIPQEIDSYPRNKGLKFIKFIVRATPHTSTEPAFVFFDQLKVLTNQFDVHFDGAQINVDWGGKLNPIKGRINTPEDK